MNSERQYIELYGQTKQFIDNGSHALINAHRQEALEQLEAQALDKLAETLVSTRDRGVQAVLLSMLQKLQNDEDFLAIEIAEVEGRDLVPYIARKRFRVSLIKEGNVENR